jgi:hypothetical protein
MAFHRRWVYCGFLRTYEACPIRLRIACNLNGRAVPAEAFTTLPNATRSSMPIAKAISHRPSSMGCPRSTSARSEIPKTSEREAGLREIADHRYSGGQFPAISAIFDPGPSRRRQA